METIYVTDLDGTLLNSRTELSESARKLLLELIDKGINFTYATARSRNSAQRLLGGLPLTLPVIVHNGVFVMDVLSGMPLFSCRFSEAETVLLADLARQLPHTPIVYTEAEGDTRISWMKGRENAGTRHYLFKKSGYTNRRPVEHWEELFEGTLFYMTCIGQESDFLPIQSVLANDSRFQCLLQREPYRNEYWCEIMPGAATKGRGLEILRGLTGAQRIVAFGDALNDIPMFQAADEGYAVANAFAQLKEVATGVIGSNDEDGVPRFLEQAFLKR